MVSSRRMSSAHHDVLRDAAGTDDDARDRRRRDAAKKLPTDDARARELIHKTCFGSLNRATDTIERVEAAGAWLGG